MLGPCQCDTDGANARPLNAGATPKTRETLNTIVSTEDAPMRNHKERSRIRTAGWLLFYALAIIHSQYYPKSTITIDSESNVLVKDVGLPKWLPWFSQFASHGYIDYRIAEEDDSSPSWKRVEVVNELGMVNHKIVHRNITEEQAHAGMRWGNPVRLVAQSKASSGLDAAVSRFVQKYDDSVYRPYPGPNSNTFAKDLILELDDVAAVMEHNAVGKHYHWRVGFTTSRTGVEIQSPFLGVAVGLQEGLEVNILGLGAGLAVWPPSIKIPFLPEFPFRPVIKQSSA